eukprot:5289999-Prymnesium_polylepis.1
MHGHTLADAPWFRFGGLAGTRMPQSSPNAAACNSLRPGWVSDAHPGLGAPASVGTRVCFRNEGDLCYESVIISICRCSYDSGSTEQLLYKLPAATPTINVGLVGGVYCGTHALVPPPPPLPPDQPPPPPSFPHPPLRPPFPPEKVPSPPPGIPAFAFCHQDCPHTESGSTLLSDDWRSVTFASSSPVCCLVSTPIIVEL